MGAFVTCSTQHVHRDDDTELKPTTHNSDNYETYLLPDGNIITVDAEVFHCIEVLFQPSFFGKEPAASTTLTPARICVGEEKSVQLEPAYPLRKL